MPINTGSEQHQFAFFVTSLNEDTKRPDGSFLLRCTDPVLIHRIKDVLRLRPLDTCILFDEQHSVEATIEVLENKFITFHCQNKRVTQPLQPSFTWLLPLLKKEAFEEALYTLTEMGATVIQPMRTTKATRSWGSEKDYARARTIMQAAAEQSKQFVLPILEPVKELSGWHPTDGSMRIFFDVGGMPLPSILVRITQSPPRSFICCAGPEGDLTREEKEYLQTVGFEFCALTPTVLRAQQAVAVGLGVLRSCFSSGSD
jgi:16S rRNA (uracil1498-N3)-methyltransferase